MRYLIIITCLLSMNLTAKAADTDFVGVYVQKTKLMTPASFAGDCDTKTQWNAESHSCVVQNENLVEIKPATDSNLYSVKVSATGSAKMTCELDLKMRLEGSKMILAQKLKDASKDYMLTIKKTRSGIQFVEKLGSTDFSTPGCSYNSFAGANGGEFTRQFPNHLTQGL